MELVRGDIYRRRDLHDHFGGQQQSGISTPAKHPIIMLFTGKTGEEHGYGYDEMKTESVFYYTGEGQPARGDMKLTRGNRQLAEHQSDNKRVFLFEKTDKTGYVRCLGEFVYVGHETKDRDSGGVKRNVIVFHLEAVDA